MQKRKLFGMALCIVLGMTFANVARANEPSHYAGLSLQGSTAAEIWRASLAQIQWYEQNGLEVPADIYDFYFAFERLAHPEFYADRHEANALDQFTDACPGGVIEQPSFDPARGFLPLTVTTYGQTTSAANNCTAPDCRYGRDVIVRLEMYEFGEIVVRTAGSTFDTYLCLYEEACCGQEGSELIESNNNAPYWNYGQPLAAGLADCLNPGTYWLVLDGAFPASRGSYCVSVSFYPFCE